MQGASPLASPGLNPGGTGFSCGKRVPAGGFASFGAGWGWRCDARRGAQGGGRPPTLPCRNPAGGAGGRRLPAFCFSFVSAPIPPTPFPSGEGGDSKFISPGATAPGTPAIGWEAALVLLLKTGTFSFSGKSFPQRARIQMRQEMPPTLEIIPAGSASAARVQAPGMQGAKPLAQNNLNSPPSRREGGRGDGGKNFLSP